MTIHTGDCVDVMAAMDAESIDAIVTDPPYGLEFMGKEWDRLWHEPMTEGRTFTNESGHMWDNTKALPRFTAGTKAQQWHQHWATEALRVAKPGAYLLAFGGTRTVHRLTVALEDAGWVIRDVLVWAYAQGFPKSKSSLKPAWEPIVLARKPGPLAPLDIDGCRLPTEGRPNIRSDPKDGRFAGVFREGSSHAGTTTNGRWPANLVLTDPIFDGGWEGVEGGGEQRSGFDRNRPARQNGTVYGDHTDTPFASHGDSGTYSRFFLIPKASRSDREPKVPGLPERLDGGVWGGDEDDPTDGKKRTVPRQNTHPTVKPSRLMRHLVRLVTPKDGTVLDPFLGSGTTAVAAEMEGFAWVGIEREPEYVRIAEQRLVKPGLEL